MWGTLAPRRVLPPYCLGVRAYAFCDVIWWMRAALNPVSLARVGMDTPRALAFRSWVGCSASSGRTPWVKSVMFSSRAGLGGTTGRPGASSSCWPKTGEGNVARLASAVLVANQKLGTDFTEDEAREIAQRPPSASARA